MNSTLPLYVRELHEIVDHLNDNKAMLRRIGLKEMCTYLRMWKQAPVDTHRVFRSATPVLLDRLRDTHVDIRKSTVTVLNALYLDFLPHSPAYLTPLWGVLTQRMGYSYVREPVRVVRQHLLDLIYEILLAYKKSTLNKITLATIGVLLLTLKEDNAGIQKRSCDIVDVLFVKCEAAMRCYSSFIIKAVVEGECSDCRVREDMARCIDVAVYRNETEGIRFAAKWMAERLCDISPIMRELVIVLVARWSMEHPRRNENFQYLIPLLFIGLHDELDGVGKQAVDLWAEIGVQYLNDRYCAGNVPTYTNPKFYPNAYKRPNLGCRLLVKNYMNEMLPAVLSDLGSSRDEARRRGSQVLCTLILHAEYNCKQYLHKLLPVMYNGARDPNEEIAANLMKAAFFVACFVDGKCWWKVFLHAFEEPLHVGHFYILRMMLRAISPNWLKSIAVEVLTSLNSPQFRNSEPVQIMAIKCRHNVKSKLRSLPIWELKLKKIYEQCK